MVSFAAKGVNLYMPLFTKMYAKDRNRTYWLSNVLNFEKNLILNLTTVWFAKERLRKIVQIQIRQRNMCEKMERHIYKVKNVDKTSNTEILSSKI